MTPAATDTLLPTPRHPYTRAQSDSGHNEPTDYDASSVSSYAPTSFTISVPPTPNPKSGIFLKLLSLWIATTILTGAVALLVTGYRAKGVLTPADKSAYNLLATVLILMLGLSFFEAFKELARSMSGRLIQTLASQGREAELIQGFDSLLKVARLITISPKWSVKVFCIFWLAINFGAQMLSALINLEVTIDDGHDYTGAYHRSGKALVSKLDCVYHGSRCSRTVTEHARAHVYGESSLAEHPLDYDDIPSLLDAQNDSQVWRNRWSTEYAHRFNEYNPNDTQQAYPYLTDRVITSSAGECIEYEQDEVTKPDRVGDKDAVRYTYRNATSNGTLSIPTAVLGRDATTYIYRGLAPPADASDSRLVVCGERCMYVWVYRNDGDNGGPKFYQCPITVSNVTNSVLPEHHVPDGVARVAAVSIALQGQFQGPADEKRFTQFQFYARGAPWEIHLHNNTAIGAKIAHFTMGSLMGIIDNNPKVLLDGTVPYLGSRLQVQTGPFTAILVCLVATHFTVFSLTYVLARQGG
ncbi:MAG: hypothetical protein Q9177_003249 [Variospora cf. flavescens]